MKIALFFFICMHFLNFIAMPPAQERYLQANKWYQEGDFKKAYDLYKGITNKSPELLINMGNAAYALGMYPEALVRWRRAQQQASYTQYAALESQIMNVEREFDIAYKTTRWQRIENGVFAFLSIVPFFVWQLLFLLVLALGWFVHGWYMRGVWLPIVVWAGILFVVTGLLMVRYSVYNRCMAFVIKDSPVYVTKNPQSRMKATFKRGQEIEVRAIHDTWYLITDGSVTGWSIDTDVQLV